MAVIAVVGGGSEALEVGEIGNCIKMWNNKTNSNLIYVQELTLDWFGW